MMKDKIRKITKPTLSQETLIQFSQLKNFIDASLKEALLKNFKSDAEKVKYLNNTLLDLRDFMMTQITENSLRINLIKQFTEMEAQELMGNSHGRPDSELLNPTAEKLEQSLLDSDKKEESVESTTDR